MSKFRKYFLFVCQSFVLLLLAPSVALAVGFGNLVVNSKLGEELNLEVDINSVTPVEIGTMSVGLGSRSDFSRAGMPYPENPRNLVFEIVEGENGKYSVVISSLLPVNETFLHILLSASWSGGKVVREYTALLDPPLYSGESAKQVDLPVSGDDSEQTYSVEGSTVTGSSESVSSAVTGGTSRVSVKKGDTLSGILNTLGRPQSVTMAQGLTAILDANPDAFIDSNMNRLKAGASLDIPSFADMAQVSRQGAAKKFQAQVEEYNQYVTGIGLPALGSEDKQEVVLSSPDTDEVTKQAPETNQDTDQALGDEAITESSTESVDQPESSSDSVANEPDVIPEDQQQEDVRLSIGQEPTDEQIAGAVSGSQGDSAQVEALKTQLAMLDESLLASGVENEEVKQRLKDIQSQVERVSRLIEIEDQGLALSQDRAASESEDESDEAIAAIALNGELNDAGDTGIVDSGSTSGTSPGEEQGGDTAINGANNENSGQLTEVTENTGEPGVSTAQVSTTSIDTPSDTSASDTSGSAESTGTGETADAADTTDTAEAVTVAATTATQTAVDNTAQPEAQTQNAPQNQPERQVMQSSIMDNITEIFGTASDYALKIVAGLIALLAALFFYRRRKSQQEFEESMLDIEIETGQVSSDPSQQSIQQLGSTAGIDLASGDSGLELTIGSGMSYLSEGGIAGVAEEDNEVVQTGAVDPMAEADVYLAYDRDEQAVQVLKEAYSTNPERTELAEKLLEIYHKQDDRLAFDGLAMDFRARIGTKQNPVWTKIAAMGKEVSPDNELYDESSDVPDMSVKLDSGAEISTPDIPPAEEIDVLNLEDEELGGAMEDSVIKSLDLDDLDLAPDSQNSTPDQALDAPTLSQIISAAEADQKEPVQKDDPEFEGIASDDSEDDEIEFGLEDDEFTLGDKKSEDLTGALERLDTEKAEPVDIDSLLSEASELAVASTEPYHESETALELAKAYIELGEKDIAKGFIEEVINEGSDKQKAKAEKLVKGLVD